MIYKWRTFDYPVSAQKAGEHIEELNRELGEVTPQIMVDDARPEDALMHPLYEWNDAKAAEKYRHNQAKKILSELVIVRVSEDERELPEPTKAFVSIKPRNESASYKPIVEALSDEDTKKQVIENARMELDSYTRKYSNLINVIPILEEAIERLKS